MTSRSHQHESATTASATAIPSNNASEEVSLGAVYREHCAAGQGGNVPEHPAVDETHCALTRYRRSARSHHCGVVPDNGVAHDDIERANNGDGRSIPTVVFDG